MCSERNTACVYGNLCGESNHQCNSIDTSNEIQDKTSFLDITHLYSFVYQAYDELVTIILEFSL